MGGISCPWLLPAIFRSAITIDGSSSTQMVVSVILACFIALMWGIWCIIANSSSKSQQGRAIPLMPGSLPWVGHALEITSNQARMHDLILEKSRLMHHATYCFWVPTLPTFYVVTDPTCLEYVLKTNHTNFVKGKVFSRNFGAILGHGIFNSDGDDWLWQRKLASNIFTVKSFKQYTDVVFGDKLQLLKDLLSQAAASGTPIDLHDLMYRFTLDSFGQIGFGVNIGCLASKGKVPFAVAFDQAQMITNARFWTPAWPLLELLNGSRARLAQDCTIIKQFATDIVNQKRAKREAAAAAASAAPPAANADTSSHTAAAVSYSGHADKASCELTPSKDLLSLFMEAVGPGGKPLIDKQLVDTVINFIIAGRDTTAQALSWTFYELMQHPEAEARLLQEIREVTVSSSSKSTDEKLTYDQVREMRYARACFLEALRLHPSVPEDVKYAVHQDTLPDGSVIPQGGQILYPIYTVNRMASFWGPDADSFRPDRWLESRSMPSPYSYLSFNAGPRLCLGQRLAEIEGVYVLVGLLAKFRFRQAVAGSKVTYNLSPTHPMKEGLHVVVEERAQ